MNHLSALRANALTAKPINSLSTVLSDFVSFVSLPNKEVIYVWLILVFLQTRIFP